MTPIDKEFVKKEYKEDPTQDNIKFLATKFDVSTKTIIAILTHSGHYKKPGYRTKSGERPVSKSKIINLIAENMQVPIDKLEGLEKCNKMALRLILDRLDEDSKRHFEV